MKYVRALLCELLPLDETRESELRVVIAFTARSIHTAPLAELCTVGYRAFVETMADAIGRSQTRLRQPSAHG